MRALKEERSSRIVLVLGDPRAGKSVALRKLAKELLKEVGQTGRVPVYVNLKEWNPQRNWTQESPPSVAELRDFILQSLKGNHFLDGFLDDYFDRMVDRGRFFFIFDSFDENPAVLDASESSWLIQHLSKLLAEFFVSQFEGRGIVASRFYRRPQFNRSDCATLEIRPFSDLQIHEALQKSEKLSPATIEKLFATRSELIPVARNPFSAALIRIYAENNGGELPATQLEMYESYIQFRFAASVHELAKLGITAEQVIDGATDIAWCMFQAPDIGLEVQVPRLAGLLPGVPVPAVTAILRFSGLARLSSAGEGSFSFVHRRLNEYFVAHKLIKDPENVVLQAIPTDSRFRDALVLYCEVGEPAHVAEIANFCWAEICNSPLEVSQATSDRSIRAVHCMRFLRDAFRTRSDVITFIPQLAEYISQRVQPNGDLLSAKLALEATGLLPEKYSEPILIQAFEMGNSWISETALNSCRHLNRISKELEGRLQEYLSTISVGDFLRRHREIVFSLSLSEAYRNLRRYCMLRSFDHQTCITAVAFCIVFSPLIALYILIFYSLGRFLFPARPLPSKLFNHTDVSERLTYTMRMYIMRYHSILWAPLLRITIASALIGFPLRSPRPYEFLLPVFHFVPNEFRGYVACWYLLLGVACLPLSDLVFWAGLIPRLQINRRFVRYTASAVSTLIVSIAIFSSVEWLVERYPQIQIVASALAALFLILVLTGYVILMLKDMRFSSRAVSSTAVTKSSIADDFKLFRTSFFRRRYVEWLRDHQVQPTGNWPNERPNYRNDQASTMLAQLDERWLGLDT